MKSYLWWRRQLLGLRRRGLSDHLVIQLWQAGDEAVLLDIAGLDDSQLAVLSNFDRVQRSEEAQP